MNESNEIIITIFILILIADYGIGWFLFGLGIGLHSNAINVNIFQIYDTMTLIAVGLFLIVSVFFLSSFFEKITGWKLEYQEVKDDNCY